MEQFIEDLGHSLGSWAYLLVAFMAMAETFFAVRFGMLRDRFGTSWMILALRPQTP